MQILTEPIGSIPRPVELVEGLKAFSAGAIEEVELNKLFERALKDTIQRFEQAGSPVITDGEQTKSSFATYPLEGLTNLAPEGMRIDFEDGHFRQLPLLTGGPFRYGNYAVKYLKNAQKQTTK